MLGQHPQHLVQVGGGRTTRLGHLGAGGRWGRVGGGMTGMQELVFCSVQCLLHTRA
jgi:hypothetical protein